MNTNDTNRIQKLTILIEQICKTKGKYIDKIAVSPDHAIKSVLNQYSEFKPSIEACIKDRKNYVNEILRFGQNTESVRDKISLVWFKKFLKYILECVKHGLHLAKTFMSKILGIHLTEGSKTNALRDFLKNYKPAVGIGAASLFAINVSLAIVSGVVLLGVGLWLSATGKIVGKLSSKPSLFEKLKNKTVKFFSKVEDDLPDDLAPPDLDVPNVTMSFNINTSESLYQHAKEHARLKILKTIFNIFCIYATKVIIATQLGLNSELAWLLSVSTGFFFSPASSLIIFCLIWLFIGITSMYNIVLIPIGGALV